MEISIFFYLIMLITVSIGLFVFIRNLDVIKIIMRYFIEKLLGK